MNTQIPEEHFKNLIKDIQNFIKSHLQTLEKENNFLEFNVMKPQLDNIREEVKKNGWWLPQLPDSSGGMNLSLEQFGRLSACLGHSVYGHYVFNCQAPDAGNMEILIEHASTQQRNSYLNPLLQGTYRSCFAMTEPENAGSNPLLLKTHAEKVDGGYVLNGRKWFCTAADGADFLIVLAITDTSFSDPRKSASLFIVPSNAKGFKHVRKISIMGDEGSGWGSHSELEFNDCFVPEDMVLGKIGAGFQIAQERLAPGRIHHCMRWIGICERIFDQLCNRAASRIIGPNKTLASKQHVQNIISENYANISAARLMVLDVAKKLDNGELQHIKRDISSIKFFCSKTLRRLMDDAIQIHGALGMTDDTLLSFYYRHERGASIYDGPDEVHKQVSARSILKTYSQYQTA